MIVVFWWVAVLITALFSVAMVIFFACQWIIYFRVERSVLQQQKLDQTTE